MLNKSQQLDLFAEVASVYADSGASPLGNDALYREIVARSGVSAERLERLEPVGRAGLRYNTFKRKIRWYQQTLKHLGVIERVPGKRAQWRLTADGQDGLRKAGSSVKVLAFSTELGVAIWARHEDVFPNMGEPISLCVTSPPYPLRRARDYGGPTDTQYADFICSALEPIVSNLLPGGSVVLNVSNDIFERGRPSRSLYLERLVLALHDRLGLHLMDRIPWVNYSKPPGPTKWACVDRVQLSNAWEPVLWFTNDPHRVRSDNRRVLEAHTEKHAGLIANGGERRSARYGDGAFRLKPGSFGGRTEGRIPRNVIERGHACKDTNAYRRHAAAAGVSAHGAIYPTALPDFFIRLLTDPQELVVDPFGGSVKTGLAAERLCRRWVVTEWIAQFLAGASGLFSGSNGFRVGPQFRAG